MKNCGNCQLPMRPRTATLVTHPGTVRIHNQKTCQSCYTLAHKKDEPVYKLPKPAEPPARIAFNLDLAVFALDGWIRDRRRRRVPEQGLPV